MKKIMALTLAALLLLTAFSGCAPEPAPRAPLRFLCSQPEQAKLWQTLAKDYRAYCGVEVKIESVDAAGLKAALETAPAMFQFSGRENAEEYCLDLSDTPLAGERLCKSLDLYGGNGELLALCCGCEAFGIAVNTALLRQAGYQLSDIRDFETLKAVAENIHGKASLLGFDAFPTVDEGGGSMLKSAGYLAELIRLQPGSARMDGLQALLDLAKTNSADHTYSDENAGNEFWQEQVAFTLTGSWAYENLLEAGVRAGDIRLIPAFCGLPGEEKMGALWAADSYWAVNAQAPEEDRAAALDFLYWAVTDQKSVELLTRELGTVQFRNSPASENGFLKDAGEMLLANRNAAGRSGDPAWRQRAAEAVCAYLSGGSWDEVLAVFQPNE